MQNKIPRYVYKYKSINTIEDLIRLIDTIRNGKMYCPTYKQLNDPLECSVVLPIPYGYAGCGMSASADEEDIYVVDHKLRYRILSFAQKCNNPLMWAHYAGDYKGVCLCLSTQSGDLKKIKEIEYCKDKEEIRVSDTEMDRVIRASLYKKADGWKYEKEWRLLKKAKKADQKVFIDIRENLCGIIIGHKMSAEIKSYLLETIQDDLEVFKTKIGYRTVGVGILKNNYVEKFGTGKPVKYVDVEKALDKRDRAGQKR